MSQVRFKVSKLDEENGVTLDSSESAEIQNDSADVKIEVPESPGKLRTQCTWIYLPSRVKTTLIEVFKKTLILNYELRVIIMID